MNVSLRIDCYLNRHPEAAYCDFLPCSHKTWTGPEAEDVPPQWSLKVGEGIDAMDLAEVLVLP